MSLRFFRTGFVILLAVLSVSAQIGRSTIAGYVFGPERSPVGQAAVELRNEVNTVIARTRTNGSGQFTFFSVPNGRLSVRVLPLGSDLEEQSQEVEVAGASLRGVPMASTTQLDFYLKPRRDAGSFSRASVVFAQQVPEDAQRAYLAAIADLASKRIDDGVRGLKRAIELFPTFFHALERLGIEEMNREKYDDATKSLAAAAAVNPRSFTSWQGLGVAHLALNNLDKAIESSKKALEIDKDSVGASLVLGLAYRGLRKFEDAENALLRAKELDKLKTPDIYWNLALLYTYNLKKYQKAADTLELYLKSNSAMPEEERRKIRTLISQLRENRVPSE